MPSTPGALTDASVLNALAPDLGCVLAIEMPSDLVAAMAVELPPGAHDDLEVAKPVHVIVDSGSDIHVVGDISLLLDVEPVTRSATPAGGARLQICGVGTLVVKLGYYYDTGGLIKPLELQIPNVYYSPECPYNLLSATMLRTHKIYLDTVHERVHLPGLCDQADEIDIGFGDWMLRQTRDEQGCKVTHIYYGGGKPVLRGWACDHGTTWSETSAVVAVLSEERMAMAAHDYRFHHTYRPTPTFALHVALCAVKWSLKRMAHNPHYYGNLNIDVLESESVPGRHQGRLMATKPQGPKPIHDSKVVPAKCDPGEVLHADLTGPISPMGIGGVRYVLFAVCAKSHYLFAYPMKKKSEAASGCHGSSQGPCMS